MKLNNLQSDRAAGVLVALAAGDALGAGYEFGPALPDDAEVTMKGGGPFGFAPAEWTDDTSMAVVIAESMLDAVTDGRVPVDDMSLSAMVQGWIDWASGARDIGMQTSAVLSRVNPMLRDRPELVDCEAAYAAAEEVHRASGRSAGNGSLMRTAPLALAYLDNEDELWDVASEVSALTHFDTDAREACALWCVAIRHAVLTGQLDVRVGLGKLAAERVRVWSQRIDAAEASLPRNFTKNGWVVQAFQGAWSAITTTADAGSGPSHLQVALEAAVRGGNDTDTVAAIAGGLLGAAYGYTAVPFEWRRRLHGWPGYRARDLMRMGLQLAKGRGRTPGQWPDLERFDNSRFISSTRTDVVEHPLDSGVLLGGAPALQRTDYDAAVSLSRVGTAETHVPDEDHASFWLLDEASPEANSHLGFVLSEAVSAIETFRSEGKRVLLHCVRMESRTPTVAALYGAKISDMDPLQALEEVRKVLPNARPNKSFMKVLHNGFLEKNRPCPHCGKSRPDHLIPRNYLCSNCVSQATDTLGRKVSLSNGAVVHNGVLILGGLAAHHEDGSDCVEVSTRGIAYIDGHAFGAGEGRFGGTVMGPLADPAPTADETDPHPHEMADAWERTAANIGDEIRWLKDGDFIVVEYGDSSVTDTDDDSAPYAQVALDDTGYWCEIVSNDFLPGDTWPLYGDVLKKSGWNAPDVDCPNWFSLRNGSQETAMAVLAGLREGRACLDVRLLSWRLATSPGTLT